MLILFYFILIVYQIYLTGLTTKMWKKHVKKHYTQIYIYIKLYFKKGLGTVGHQSVLDSSKVASSCHITSLIW